MQAETMLAPILRQRPASDGEEGKWRGIKVVGLSAYGPVSETKAERYAQI
jgi:hypothetical protein